MSRTPRRHKMGSLFSDWRQLGKGLPQIAKGGTKDEMLAYGRRHMKQRKKLEKLPPVRRIASVAPTFLEVHRDFKTLLEQAEGLLNPRLKIDGKGPVAVFEAPSQVSPEAVKKRKEELRTMALNACRNIAKESLRKREHPAKYLFSLRSAELMRIIRHAKGIEKLHNSATQLKRELSRKEKEYAKLCNRLRTILERIEYLEDARKSLLNQMERK